MSKWFLYVLKCNGGSLYTGITIDLEKRLEKHNAGKASRYTRAKRPVILTYKEVCKSESLAKKREAEVKKLSRKDKLELIMTR